MPWDDDYLAFAVRESVPGKVTGTCIMPGIITRSQPLWLAARMVEHGVIYRDGLEQDYLQFYASASASIMLADREARLVA
jgi:hypothetical protein